MYVHVSMKHAFVLYMWQPCTFLDLHTYIPVIPPVDLGDGMSVLVVVVVVVLVVVVVVVVVVFGGDCGTSTITVLLSSPLSGTPPNVM